MDYINYVKEYPMMGQIGLGGGACSLGRFSAGGEPVPDGSTYFGDRAMIMGGQVAPSPGISDQVQIKNITTTANSTDFGDLIISTKGGAGASDSVRGIVAGGRNPTGTSFDMIQYHVIPVQGVAIDFGNLTEGRSYASAASDGTRAIFHGGGAPSPNFVGQTNCQKITTQTLGNATSVGSLSTGKMMTFGGSNGTRGIIAGGNQSGSATPNTYSRIDYYTMATFTSGNAAEFGSLSTAFSHGTGTSAGGSASNTSRFLFMMGMHQPSGGQHTSNQCVYINIANTGNASDFGDSDWRVSDLAGFNNATRGGWGGGYFNNYYNHMAYFTIATTGNTTAFGDLVSHDQSGQGACSGAAS